MDFIARSIKREFRSPLVRVRENEIAPEQVALQLSNQGLAPQDIGRLMNTNTKQVCQWLEVRHEY